MLATTLSPATHESIANIRQGLGVIPGNGASPPFLPELDAIFAVSDVETHITPRWERGYIHPETDAEQAFFALCGETVFHSLGLLGIIERSPGPIGRNFMAVYRPEGNLPAHPEAMQPGVLQITSVLFGQGEFWSETTGNTVLNPGDIIVQDLATPRIHSMPRAITDRGIATWDIPGQVL